MFIHHDLSSYTNDNFNGLLDLVGGNTSLGNLLTV